MAIEPVPGEPGWDEYARRAGPTPDTGYGLYSAAQPGQPQGSQTDVTGDGGADLGYRAVHEAADGWHDHLHAQFDGRGGVDGMHAHPHQHRGDGSHQHRHVYPDSGDMGGPVPHANSSSGRRGTGPRERSQFLADLDGAGLAEPYSPEDDSDGPACVRRVVAAERTLELAERDFLAAKDAFVAARGDATQDRTVPFDDQPGDDRSRTRVVPNLAGRVLSPAARSRWLAYESARELVERAEAAYDRAQQEMSAALAVYESAGLNASPVLPPPRGRSADPDEWDGLSRIDRNRR